MRNIREFPVSRGFILLPIMSLAILFAANPTNAHCGGKHGPSHPHCGGGSPPPDGNADPQFVYSDGAIFLANTDGTSQTQIRSGGIGPKLDLLNERVLFIHKADIANRPYVGMLSYTIDSGNIVVGPEQILIHKDDLEGGLGGKISSEGVSDWSPDGSKYSYSYWTGGGEQAVYKMMVAPDPVLSPGGTHSLAYASEPGGGLNSATWDASGEFIYHQDNPLDGSFPNGLFVIDVRTFPGKTAKAIDLSSIFVAAGFSAESNVQSISASYETGGDQSIGGNPGAYSFDPGNPVYPASSDTSLCLMLSVIDWSLKFKNRFVVIIDLPKYFDPTASGDGLSCSIATDGTPILNFQGNDFTTADAGIVGPDSSKNRVQGIWVHELGSGSRTKIISDGGGADWAN